MNVGVALGTSVGVEAGTSVGVEVGTWIAVDVLVGVEVENLVAVGNGVGVSVGGGGSVGIAVGVSVGGGGGSVGIVVGVAVGGGGSVGVAFGVGVLVGWGVCVGVCVGVGRGCASSPSSARAGGGNRLAPKSRTTVSRNAHAAKCDPNLPMPSAPARGATISHGGLAQASEMYAKNDEAHAHRQREPHFPEPAEALPNSGSSVGVPNLTSSEMPVGEHVLHQCSGSVDGLGLGSGAWLFGRHGGYSYLVDYRPRRPRSLAVQTTGRERGRRQTRRVSVC